MLDNPRGDPINRGKMLTLKKTLLTQKPSEWANPVASLVLVISFILSVFYWQGVPAIDFLTASREQIFRDHEYWRLLTTTFIHADIVHFLSNSIFFFIFGYLLYGYFGVWIFPVVSLILGALVNFITLASYPSQTSLIGASGVVYLMVGFWAVMFYFIDRKQSSPRRFIAALGVSLCLFFPSEYEPHVSYTAHGIGFGVGMIAAMIYFVIMHKSIRAKEVWVDVVEEDDHTPGSPDSLDKTEEVIYLGDGI